MTTLNLFPCKVQQPTMITIAQCTEFTYTRIPDDYTFRSSYCKDIYGCCCLGPQEQLLEILSDHVVLRGVDERIQTGVEEDQQHRYIIVYHYVIEHVGSQK